MKYTIYKTTNDINNHFYIGKHQTNNIYDKYLGSGIRLKKAIKKYGKEHFHKEILFVFDTEKEMNEKEKELITEQLVQDPNCYNMTFGGEGGDTWTITNKKHSEETKQKLREIQLKNLQNPEYREKVSKNKKLAFQKMKNDEPERYYEMARKRGETLSRRIKESGGKSKETNQKISESLKKTL